jgi:hypothetical protein
MKESGFVPSTIICRRVSLEREAGRLIYVGQASRLALERKAGRSDTIESLFVAQAMKGGTKRSNPKIRLVQRAQPTDRRGSVLG